MQGEISEVQQRPDVQNVFGSDREHGKGTHERCMVPLEMYKEFRYIKDI